MAIGADAAAARHAAQIFGKFPFGDARYLDIGRLATRMQRLLGAVDLEVAQAGGDDDRLVVVLLDRLEDLQQFRLEAAGLHLLGLQPQAVRRKARKAGERGHFLELRRVVLDLFGFGMVGREQRIGAGDAGQGA